MFKIGTKVKIIGLVNAPRYNKKYGKVICSSSPPNDKGVRRIGIELLSYENECISVKIENVFLPSSVHPKNVVFYQCSNMLEYIEDNINFFFPITKLKSSSQRC